MGPASGNLSYRLFRFTGKIVPGGGTHFLATFGPAATRSNSPVVESLLNFRQTLRHAQGFLFFYNRKLPRTKAGASHASILEIIVILWRHDVVGFKGFSFYGAPEHCLFRKVRHEIAVFGP
jgi:hypothetical protein